MAKKEDILELTLADQAGKLLLKKEQTLAVAESVTAGHLQVAFSLAENAMDFFEGGITVYNLGQKSRHLRVEPIRALACNCVSEHVAAQMAKEVAVMFTADWTIAVTGYASPVPEENIYDLFACYAIYFRGKEVVRKKITVEKNSPEQVRIGYTNIILQQFVDLLK